MADRVRVIGRPLALVGWSIGGYFAGEVARDLPDAVDVAHLGMGFNPTVWGHVITALESGDD